MGWITLPRNLLEQQFDSLGLERHFENGITDTAENVERLSDYPDYEGLKDNTLCPKSGTPVEASDQIEEEGPRYKKVVCARCKRVVRAFWKKSVLEWTICNH